VFNNVTKLLEFHPEFSTLAALLPKVPEVAGAQACYAMQGSLRELLACPDT
jgi:hypothetical protein